MSSPSNVNEENSCRPVFLSCFIKHDGYETNDFSLSNGKTNLQKSPTDAPTAFNSARSKSEKTILWDTGNIETLPDAANIFPLEWTRVSVDHHVSPNTIGRRVCDSLRDLSISIVSKKGHKLLAESFDRDVRFYIKLYKEKFDHVDGGSGNNKPTGNYRVMVELQKRRGCAASFGQMARTILQMAKNGHYEQEEEFSQSNGKDTFPSLPNYQPKITVAGVNEFHSKWDKEVSCPPSCDLRRTADLIRDKYMDSSLLGMQNLVFLSNSNTTNYETALRVANLVLEDYANGIDCDLGLSSLIKSFICADFCEENNILEDSFQEWYFSKMHYYALTVLANAMHTLSTFDGGLVSLHRIVSTERWLEEKNGLLSVLIYELNATAEKPHNAYQAMRCINVLFQVPAPEVHMKAMEWGASSAIWTARNIGQSCHSLLAHESELAMENSFSALKPGW
eukprot:CAMPEP_0185735800 /NCGR_PEP_ID=MMETSP1171-20130828/26248_1 /TAXON_ID=374046 /ORGANISM="Helicotheca tamensis, Strain CCMP826" /LENGTH=449 /DNA_ID=CAMNT_0028406229 /DNA_START=95 /DNA_END=1441 /DNA_ORIENTATION=-